MPSWTPRLLSAQTRPPFALHNLRSAGGSTPSRRLRTSVVSTRLRFWESSVGETLSTRNEKGERAVTKIVTSVPHGEPSPKEPPQQKRLELLCYKKCNTGPPNRSSADRRSINLLVLTVRLTSSLTSRRLTNYLVESRVSRTLLLSLLRSHQYDIRSADSERAASVRCV